MTLFARSGLIAVAWIFVASTGPAAADANEPEDDRALELLTEIRDNLSQLVADGGRHE